MMEACRELAAAEISGACCSALQRGLAAAADLHLNVGARRKPYILQHSVWSLQSALTSLRPRPAPVTRDPSAAPAPVSAGADVVKATGRGVGKI